MKNKTMFLLILPMLFGCNNKIDNFDVLNQKLNNHYAKLTLEVKTIYEDEALYGNYFVTYANNSYNVTYLYEQLNQISLTEPNEQRKSIIKGKYTYNNEIIDGNEANLPFEVISLYTLKFDKSNFTNVSFDDVFVANVKLNKLFSIDNESLSTINVYYDADNINRLILTTSSMIMNYSLTY